MATLVVPEYELQTRRMTSEIETEMQEERGPLVNSRLQSLTLKEKIALRHLVLLVMCISLPLSSFIRSIAGDALALLPILGFMFTSLPISESSVGVSTDFAIRVTLFWTLYLLFMFIFILCNASIVAYICLMVLPPIPVLLVGYSSGSPRWLLPSVLSSLSYQLVIVLSYELHNTGASDATLFKVVSQFSFSVLTPVWLSAMLSVTLFPWYAEQVCKKQIIELWKYQQLSLREIRGVYNYIAHLTLFTPDETVSFDQGKIDGLTSITSTCDEIVLRASQSMENSLLETRWRFGNAGKLLMDTYRGSRTCVRFVRAAAEDMLLKLKRNQPSTTMYTTMDPQLKHQLCDHLNTLNIQIEGICSKMPEFIFETDSIDIQSMLLKAKETWKVVEKLSIIWIHDVISLEFDKIEVNRFHVVPLKLTKLATYVATLGRYLEAIEDAVLLANQTPAPWTLRELVKPPAMEVTAEGLFIERDRINVFIANFVNPSLLIALKLVVGSILLSIPSITNWHSDINFLHVQFTYWVVLYRLDSGYVLFRVMERVGGVFLGYVYFGLAYGICYGVFGAQLIDHEWVLALLMIPVLLSHLWIANNHYTYTYASFALLRTYTSIQYAIVDQQPSASDCWRYGGYVTLSTIIGALAAVIMNFVYQPSTSSKRMLLLLSNVFYNLSLMTENIILHRYSDSGVSSQVNLAETSIGYALHGKAVPLMKGIRFESSQRIIRRTTYADFEKVVEATKSHFYSLWKLHHIGSFSIVRADCKSSTARLILRNNRLITTGTLHLALSFLTHDSLMAAMSLRPLVASPDFLNGYLNDYMIQLYQDEQLREYLVKTQDLYLILDMILFRDLVYDMGQSMSRIYDFLEKVQRRSKFGEMLRSKEYLSFYREENIKTE